MRRSILLTLAAFGALVSIIGGVGLFSALTDTARSGTNSIESDALAASADIRIANAIVGGVGVNGSIQCGEFSEDLESGFFTLSSMAPGSTTPMALFCLSNVGSQTVTLTALVDDLTDVDVACTGDESLSGDETCGDLQAGELSDALTVRYTTFPSCNLDDSSEAPIGMRYNATTPQPLAIAPSPGTVGCFGTTVAYGGGGNLVQQAQSDRVTWRYRFSAQAG